MLLAPEVDEKLLAGAEAASPAVRDKASSPPDDDDDR